jgi:hypothetical protein
MIRFPRVFFGQLTLIVLAVSLFAVPPARAADGGDAAVVVELFTSQGCSSCPAADAYLGELAERKDVIALSEHVDYWNYIGWVDRFASEQTTRRQKAYMHSLGAAYVYTPQMVINGASHVVGSDKAAVVHAIEAAREKPGPHLAVSMTTEANGRVHLSIPAGQFSEPASILLVAFDRQHETDVTAGENTGRSIVNYHVVRGFAEIGRYDGKATSIVLGPDNVPKSMSWADGCAVLLQSEGSGAIVGAGMTWLKPAGS